MWLNCWVYIITHLRVSWMTLYVWRLSREQTAIFRTVTWKRDGLILHCPTKHNHDEQIGVTNFAELNQ